MAMIDDDGDDVAINEISNNMKLPIYAILVGRVSFLHPLTVVFSLCLFVCFLVLFCFLIGGVCLMLFSLWGGGLNACAQCRFKSKNIYKNKNGKM